MIDACLPLTFTVAPEANEYGVQLRRLAGRAVEQDAEARRAVRPHHRHLVVLDLQRAGDDRRGRVGGRGDGQHAGRADRGQQGSAQRHRVSSSGSWSRCAAASPRAPRAASGRPLAGPWGMAHCRRMDWPALLAWRMRRQQLAERRAGGGGPRRGLADRGPPRAGHDLGGRRAARPRRRARRTTSWHGRCGATGRSSRRGRCAGRCTCSPRDELPSTSARSSRLRPRHHQPAWQRAYGVTREQADAMLAAIPEVLAREPLTRAELAARGRAQGGGRRRWRRSSRDGFGALLKPAAFAGDLVLRADRRAARALHPPGG